MVLPDQFQVAQLARTESTAAAAVAAWRRMKTLDDWGTVVNRLVLITSAGQVGSAKAATGYVQSNVGPAVGELNPSAFMGAATDVDNLVYRPLDSYLYGSIVHARGLYGSGLTDGEIMAAGEDRLKLLVRSQVADSARGAVGSLIAATPRAHSYRVIQPPCCQRCAVLRDVTFAWNSPFSRHPRCFPAGVAVSGPALRAATRRWYEGELVILSTASGQELPVTGNHPILTSRGWVPANLIHEGDEVVRSTSAQGATALVVPDHDQVPSLIEDVWRSFSMGGLDRVPSSPEDFHGDGQAGEVDVVRPYRPLLGHGSVPVGHHLPEGLLGGAARLATLLDSESMAQFVDQGRTAHPSCSVCGSGLELPLGGGHLRRAHESGLAARTALDSGLFKSPADYVAGHAVLTAQRVLAGTGQVGRSDGIYGQFVDAPRWDAPGDSFTGENRLGYASRGADLLHRLAGQVELDRVVEVRRVGFRGHVYSLDSSEGWHSANSLIVSNCDCMQGPILSEEQAKFSYVEPGDVTDLTIAQRRAMADGADMNQVINAKRGQYPITVGGRKVKLTKEGTTKRSWNGYVQKEIARQKGEDLKLTTEQIGRRGAVKNYTVSRVKPRLTPEAIYQHAGTREEAIRLLARNGYIVGDLSDIARLAA